MCSESVKVFGVDNCMELQLTTSTLLSHFCNKEIYSDNRLSEYLQLIIAKQLAASFKSTHLNEDTAGNDFHYDVELYDSSYYSHSERRVLDRIYGIVNGSGDELFSSFFIHGSMATYDYIPGWSDVDIFAVIPSGITQDAATLLKLRDIVREINDLILLIAPYQHHGLILLHEGQLNSYRGDILPVEIFPYMKSMKDGVNNIMGKHIDDISSSKNRYMRVLNFLIGLGAENEMRTHAYQDQYLMNRYQNDDNSMYQFKYFLEQFTLLPSLYLSSIGKSCYKKYSFELVRGVFPDAALNWIDVISQVREDWRKHKNKGNKIPDWVKQRIASNYFELGSEVADLIKKSTS